MRTSVHKAHSVEVDGHNAEFYSDKAPIKGSVVEAEIDGGHRVTVVVEEVDVVYCVRGRIVRKRD